MSWVLSKINSLEASQQGTSNELPQNMFSWRNKKIKHNVLAEAYNSTNRAMILETTYRRKVPLHWLADSSSDWH